MLESGLLKVGLVGSLSMGGFLSFLSILVGIVITDRVSRAVVIIDDDVEFETVGDDVRDRKMTIFEELLLVGPTSGKKYVAI